MEDGKIVALYWARDERAISETSAKYGQFCHYIASNILSSREDCEECVNDTYLGLWNAIPPRRPERFRAFTGRVTRNLALKRYEYLTAAKRNREAECSLEELTECVSGRESVEDELENRRIEAALTAFLRAQSRERREIFVRRYWYFEPLDSICRQTGYSLSKVKSILFEMRKKLRAHLEGEGIEI